MGQAQSTIAEELSIPRRDEGSFRDPSGFVCYLEDDVYRAVDASFGTLFEHLERSGLLDRLQREGRLIRTRSVGPHETAFQTLRKHAPDVRHVLQHNRIPFISYPYEWSPTMLADAANCCLDLQHLLVRHGMSLKDASTYNIQFVGARPVFIDVPSIERVVRRDVWIGLDQFCRMFLYPLLLERFARCSLREYFLSHLDGADLDDVYTRFGFAGALRLSLLVDVWIPFQLHRLFKGTTSTLRAGLKKGRDDPSAQILNLNRLRRKMSALAGKCRHKSHWLNYAARNSYDESARSCKESFVREVLARHPVKRVLDLGCNTGQFSELAAQTGALVVAADTDVHCVDTLYRRTRDSGLNILPMVMDVANPSPGVGYRNVERASFRSRASFDCVMALALMHHLLITNRLPMESICRLLAELTSDVLIFEYVDPADEMFTRVLGARKNIYQHISLSLCRELFRKRFEILSEASLTNHRFLLAMRKR